MEHESHYGTNKREDDRQPRLLDDFESGRLPVSVTNAGRKAVRFRLVMFIGLIDQAFDFNIIPDAGRIFLSHFSTGFALID